MTERRENCQKRRTLLIGIFSHIEVYPPSLNALYHLAPMFDDVYVLVRNVWNSNWKYPPNVHIITSGTFVPLERVGQNNLRKKLAAYVAFGSSLRSLYKAEVPSVVLLYDAAAFSLFNLFVRLSPRARRPLVWYHNHDVSVEDEVGKFSLMRLMKKLEIYYFSNADIFSLPNQVRLKYFPVASLRITPFVIPNFPSSFFFGKWRRNNPATGENLRLIFQGHISPSNSIENFVEVLCESINGHKLELHLAGPIHAAYQHTLAEIADRYGVADRLFFYGRLPYAELPALTSSCHFGLAIYGFHNTMVRTMSTASNKIFEYACVGLPVLINRRDDLQTEFDRYPWIHFIDKDRASVKRALETIFSNYAFYSSNARKDFEQKLNFESAIAPVKSYIQQKLEAL